MLALVLAVLSAVAGLPSGGMGEAGGVEGLAVEASSHVVEVGPVPCCETEAEGAPEPCGPSDECPPFGGCCACVSCGKRVADAPSAVAPVAAEGEPVDRVPAGAPSGIDGGGAVWHPPRG